MQTGHTENIKRKMIKLRIKFGKLNRKSHINKVRYGRKKTRPQNQISLIEIQKGTRYLISIEQLKLFEKSARKFEPIKGLSGL